jgi:hypothetical protein
MWNVPNYVTECKNSSNLQTILGYIKFASLKINNLVLLVVIFKICHWLWIMITDLLIC